MKLKIFNYNLIFCISKKYFCLVLIEIKHKIDLDATYFKFDLAIIKFPTLEISCEWGDGFTSVPLRPF